MTIGFAIVAGLLAVWLVTGILCLLYTWRTTRRIEAAMPPTGRFVAVPGARLHVVEQGQGPAVLLVHGLAGQLGHFGYGMVEPLARDFRVIAVDRPAQGIPRGRRAPPRTFPPRPVHSPR